MNYEKAFTLGKLFIAIILIVKIIAVIVIVYLCVKLLNNPEIIGEFVGKILKGFETAKQ
jgi:hypothetical protein